MSNKKKENFNEWTFSGGIFYYKELDEGEFALSLKLRGVSKRVSAMSVQVTEISCLAEKPLLDELKQRDSQRNNLRFRDFPLTISLPLRAQILYDGYLSLP